MGRVNYGKAIRLAKLHDELLAAAVAPTYVGGDFLTVPDGQEAAATAVIAAHDPTTPSPAEQQGQADTTTLTDYRTQYQALRDKANAGITAATTDQTANSNDATVAAGAAWDTLTGAQRTGAIRNLLAREGRRLNREIETYQSLLDLLDSLRVLVRERGG